MIEVKINKAFNSHSYDFYENMLFISNYDVSEGECKCTAENDLCT